MPDTVDINSFSDEIQKLLKEYGEDVQKIVDEQIVEVQKEDTKELKKTSPKDQGEYRKGWKLKVKEGRLGVETTVYNSTHGWLVHLLEHGHAKRDGGRVEAKPHIGPVLEKAEKKILDRIKEKL